VGRASSALDIVDTGDDQRPGECRDIHRPALARSAFGALANGTTRRG
jgi:hypothetical protein